MGRAMIWAVVAAMWAAAAHAADSVGSWYTPPIELKGGAANQGYPEEPAGLEDPYRDPRSRASSDTEFRPRTAPRSDRGWRLNRIDNPRGLDEPLLPEEERLNRPRALELRLNL